MAYSHSRLRRTLALVRVLTGTMFLVTGAYKITSWEFIKIEFPQFISDAMHGGAVGFYGDLLHAYVWPHPTRFALVVATTELFIGVGLLLGIAVRPVSLIGILYSLNSILATLTAPVSDSPLSRYVDSQARFIAFIFVFLLLGIGHAGEDWGLGAIYHHHRLRDAVAAPVEEEFVDEVEEPVGFGETYSERYGADDEEPGTLKRRRKAASH